MGNMIEMKKYLIKSFDPVLLETPDLLVFLINQKRLHELSFPFIANDTGEMGTQKPIVMLPNGITANLVDFDYELI
jgi:hypothetical protein